MNETKNTESNSGFASQLKPSELPLALVTEEVNFSPELAEELKRIELEVEKELDLKRQQELERIREIARFD